MHHNKPGSDSKCCCCCRIIWIITSGYACRPYHGDLHTSRCGYIVCRENKHRRRCSKVTTNVMAEFYPNTNIWLSTGLHLQLGNVCAWASCAGFWWAAEQLCRGCQDSFLLVNCRIGKWSLCAISSHGTCEESFRKACCCVRAMLTNHRWRHWSHQRIVFQESQSDSRDIHIRQQNLATKPPKPLRNVLLTLQWMTMESHVMQAFHLWHPKALSQLLSKAKYHRNTDF